jgi:H+/gluconate symporter-like permease
MVCSAYLVAVGLLIRLAYRGWSILLLAPAAALITSAFSGEPLLAHWTQTFMPATAQFLAQLCAAELVLIVVRGARPVARR